MAASDNDSTETAHDSHVLERDDPPVLGANPLVGLSATQVAASLARLGERLLAEPSVVVSTALTTTSQLIDVVAGRSDVAPARGDKRFLNDAFTDNALYHRIMQAYLVSADSALSLIDDADLDDKSRERARFALSLITEAAAPTNNLLGNPEAIKTAIETRGRSLVDGLRHAAYDARHNGGMPSTVDTRPFEVGVNVAITPGSVVYRSEVFELVQYAPQTKQIHKRPLVAIPPQINKYYISDIAPGRSLIEHAVQHGVPYFAMSWRNPTPEQRDWDLDTYVEACREAIDVASEICKVDDVNLIGMCAGAITMSALLGYLVATGDDHIVNSATYLVAGLDTSVETQVGMLASKAAVEAARARSKQAGVLSGSDLAKVFAWLRPNDLVWNYWVNNYLLGKNPPAFDILYWNDDTTNLPAGLHADFLDLYATNGLVEGTVEVFGTPVNLTGLDIDTYVVAGETDHIVPWQLAFETTQIVGGNSQFVLSSSGHIQSIVNPPTNPKSSFRTIADDAPTTSGAWYEAAEVHGGTWWKHWTDWLDERSGGHRKAPAKLGNKQNPALEPAPGLYVQP